MSKILLVEDDAAVAAVVTDALEENDFVVDAVSTGSDGLDRLRHYMYDLAILDWNLPGMEGIDILRTYRGSGGSIPILMLTGKDKLPDKEVGFNSGADDYLVKPFLIKELLLRVKALLRRPQLYEVEEIEFANVVIAKTAHKVMVDRVPIDLLPKEFQLLQFLVRYPEQVFSGDHLLNKLWPNDSESTVTALRSAVKRLRKKLSTAKAKCNVKAIYGIGYKLEKVDVNSADKGTDDKDEDG